MTSKLKLVLVAAITAMSIASPALAQTAMQNGRIDTHQERSLRSQQIPDSSGAFTPTYVPGFGNDNVGPSNE